MRKVVKFSLQLALASAVFVGLSQVASAASAPTTTPPSADSIIAQTKNQVDAALGETKSGSSSQSNQGQATDNNQTSTADKTSTNSTMTDVTMVTTDGKGQKDSNSKPATAVTEHQTDTTATNQSTSGPNQTPTTAAINPNDPTGPAACCSTQSVTSHPTRTVYSDPSNYRTPPIVRTQQAPAPPASPLNTPAPIPFDNNLPFNPLSASGMILNLSQGVAPPALAKLASATSGHGFGTPAILLAGMMMVSIMVALLYRGRSHVEGIVAIWKRSGFRHAPRSDSTTGYLNLPKPESFVMLTTQGSLFWTRNYTKGGVV